jgi:nucleoside-diphosphate-sugar epimerase
MTERDTILVLGAEGFIGGHLRDRLSKSHRLSSVDVRPLVPVRARIGDEGLHGERLLRCDLGDVAQVDALFEAVSEEKDRLAAVIHLAAHYDFRNKPDARYERLHVGLRHLLECLNEHVCCDVPLIYASSMASLAPTDPGRKMTEASPRLGAWMYPASKIEAENILRVAASRRPIVELILAGVYSDLGELVPLFNQIELVRSRSIEKYMYPGPTDRGLTYVHITETVDAFVRAVDRFYGRLGAHRFLIGQEQPVTYAYIHGLASETFYGKKLPVLRIPPALAYAGAHMFSAASALVGKQRFLQPWMIRFAGEHFEFDLSHTSAHLGWKPWRALHDDLPRLLELARYHPNIWLEINRRRPW